MEAQQRCIAARERRVGVVDLSVRMRRGDGGWGMDTGLASKAGGIFCQVYMR